MRGIRKFDKQKDPDGPLDVHIGIHPGVPLRGKGANENRFDLLIEDLMTPENSNYPVVQSNYLWGLDSTKKTLREFEKEIYYTNGDYDKAYTQLFQRRILTGQHEFNK